MAWRTVIEQSGELLLDLILPRRCVGCGAQGEFLCLSCRNLLPKLTPPYCERCAVPFRGGKLCLGCRNSPPAVNRVRSLFLHQGVARDAVHNLKYRRIKALAKPLAALMAEYLRSNPMPVDLILPVPMHPRRVRERGYNQSDLLAKELSCMIDLPIDSESLVRLRNTPSQISLGAEARRRNVQGSFYCKNPTYHGKNMLLIDDVCTTGATLNACAVSLKEAGAASVWGLTFSREQQEHQG